MNLVDILGLDVQSLSVGTMNAIVTNVPGPTFPLYLLGARLLRMAPFAPLIENLGLSIGVITYDGKMIWGFNGDLDMLPDLADFRLAIERAFVQLAESAKVEIAEPQGATMGAGESASTADRPVAAAPTTQQGDLPTAH